MKTIGQLIGTAPRPPIAVTPEDTVLTALKTMANMNIGAVVVVESGRLVGIFSERDYARKVILCGKNSTDTKVAEIMTGKVLYVSPAHTVSQAMALMTEKHVRHMPVLDTHNTLLTVISLGDLVKETISDQAFQIQQLEQYIAG